MGTSCIYRRPGRKSWYLHVHDTQRRKRFRESAHTTDENVARQRLAEAERLVTLGAYVPPGERRREAERLGISLHTAIAEFVANMVTNRKSKSYVDTTAYLLFNFLEFFEQVNLRDGYGLAPEQLPKCRLRIAKYKATPPDHPTRPSVFSSLMRAIAASKITGHVRFHDLRHTAYTKLKEALFQLHDPDLGLADMRLIFGHADRSMDRVYDHRTVERLRKLMSIMPLVEGVKELLAA